VHIFAARADIFAGLRLIRRRHAKAAYGTVIAIRAR
jgi:hypothetical protein